MNESATSCAQFQLLKQAYESTLREEALYEIGGPASFQQAIKYKGEAKAASTDARDRFIDHYKRCTVCRKSRES
jgi:hypothetical protein